MSDNSGSKPTHRSREDAHKAKTLEAAGWGFLLVWLGITMLFKFSGPVFLIGLGVLVIALQWVRFSWNIAVETFWLILGIVFVASGTAELLGTGFPLVPVALILFGLAALYGVYKRLNE